MNPKSWGEMVKCDELYQSLGDGEKLLKNELETALIFKEGV